MSGCIGIQVLVEVPSHRPVKPWAAPPVGAEDDDATDGCIPMPGVGLVCAGAAAHPQISANAAVISQRLNVTRVSVAGAPGLKWLGIKLASRQTVAARNRRPPTIPRVPGLDNGSCPASLSPEPQYTHPASRTTQQRHQHEMGQTSKWQPNHQQLNAQ